MLSYCKYHFSLLAAGLCNELFQFAYSQSTECPIQKDELNRLRDHWMYSVAWPCHRQMVDTFTPDQLLFAPEKILTETLCKCCRWLESKEPKHVPAICEKFAYLDQMLLILLNGTCVGIMSRHPNIGEKIKNFVRHSKYFSYSCPQLPPNR